MFEKKKNSNIGFARYGGLLNWKAGKYIEALKEIGLYGQRILFREYMVKVMVKESDQLYGYVKIYFKPSENLFKISLDEIETTESERKLRSLWDRINSKPDCYKMKKTQIIW